MPRVRQEARVPKEDKRSLCAVMLGEACRDFPEYSFGDILYTVLRKMAYKNGCSVSFLREVPDDEMLMEIDRLLGAEYGG